MAPVPLLLSFCHRIFGIGSIFFVPHFRRFAAIGSNAERLIGGGIMQANQNAFSELSELRNIEHRNNKVFSTLVDVTMWQSQTPRLPRTSENVVVASKTRDNLAAITYFDIFSHLYFLTS